MGYDIIDVYNVGKYIMKEEIVQCILKRVRKRKVAGHIFP